MHSQDARERSTLRLPLSLGAPHPCAYLPDREAVEVVIASPEIDSRVYQALMDRGFRRSGMIFYKPHCPTCRACVPIRVPVADFLPSRSQRRTQRINADVRVACGRPVCDDARVALHAEYQRVIHGRDERPDARDYERFLADSPIDTMEMTYWIGDSLVGVGIVDVCPDSLSSVYFYYDPARAARRLGTYSALCEIEECRRRGRAYWYIGYYVEGCAKMEYKADFRPHEFLHADGGWG